MLYKKRIEKSSYFSKFFFERIPNVGGISKMGLKQTVQKIGEFEKSKFVKSGLDHKRLLKQNKEIEKFK